MKQSPVWRAKAVLLVASLVALQCLVRAAVDEYSTDWRAYQTQYAAALKENAVSTGTPASKFPIELRQSYLKHLDLDRVDRCTSCHVGIDNPAFADAAQPLRAHSGDLLGTHPPDRFGCTICHEGQGRATEKDAAHGHVPNWTKPLLRGDFVQAACAKCHRGEEIPQAPVLARGRRLMRERGCTGCHRAGDIVARDPVGPRLDAIGSKVTRKWLNKWLTNAKDYLPKARMPHYALTPHSANALAAWLMTHRNEAIDTMPERKGHYDAGANVYREAQCIVCHVTKLDYADNPVGGEIGPNLLRLGNKVNQRWLVAFFRNPHAFLPNTKMPRFHFSEQEALDLSQFAMEEWVDFDLLDAEEAEPDPPPDTPELVEQGKRLFSELGCAACHELNDDITKPEAPDLSFMGSALVHQLDFGEAQVRRTLPDFLYTKVKSPSALRPVFTLPPEQDAVEVIWNNLRPAALFSKGADLPAGSRSEQLSGILSQTQAAGFLDSSVTLPQAPASEQAEWLIEQLNPTGALDPHRMPDFQLSQEEAKAITIALMSLTEETVSSRKYEVQATPRDLFAPQDGFGKLERTYRCLSCHSIRDSGELLASDLTYEGSRVNREWLYHYLNKPYSMRRTLTIAMPIFHFPDEESKLMADYMSQVFVDTKIGADWERHRDEANVERGQQLFDEKGCIACHQLHGTGGDVGPSLTTQVPEFPHGTWVGDKLNGGWIYQWLKNPQALLPETLEPNLGLTDQEALDLTAFLLSLKSPDFQANDSEKAAE